MKSYVVHIRIKTGKVCNTRESTAFRSVNMTYEMQFKVQAESEEEAEEIALYRFWQIQQLKQQLSAR